MSSDTLAIHNFLSNNPRTSSQSSIDCTHHTMPLKTPVSIGQLARPPPPLLAPWLFTPRVQQRTMRSIVNRKHATKMQKLSRFNRIPSRAPLKASVEGALERKAYTTPPRSGALAVKKGMTAIYSQEDGKRTPCTILQLDRVQVVGHKTRRRHGYYAVQVGIGWRHESNVGRPMLGVYAQRGVAPKQKIAEFKVKDPSALLKLGETITPSWFQEGQFVDARSNSRGQGFAGGMKRHGWGGQPASHGQSLTHRTMGSSGGGQGSGSRVHPGKNMPGRMGNEQCTIQNLKVIKVDDVNGLVLVGGKNELFTS